MNKLLFALSMVVGMLGCVDKSQRMITSLHAESASKSSIENQASVWSKYYASGMCRIYTFIDVKQTGESEPVRMFLEVTESSNIFLTALNTRGYHERFYSTNPPTYISLNHKDYVPVRFFFNENFPGVLSVDGKQVSYFTIQNSQIKANPKDFDEIVKSLKCGKSATIEYSSFLRGKGQKVSFSLVDFATTFDSIPPSAAVSQKVIGQVNPIFILKPLLVGNRFNVSDLDLRVKNNPYGDGVFVYVPKTRYFDFGVKRLFLWFVKNNKALKLNGATHHLTPSLSFPQSASLHFWDGTGLNEENITSHGLKIGFGH